LGTVSSTRGFGDYPKYLRVKLILSNVAGLTEVLRAIATDGQRVTADLIACINPYLRKHIRRFGRPSLDIADMPNPLNPQPLPFEAVL
jgi:hypothetical protein